MTYKRPDHFARKAKSEGFAARSVYKLDEIESRFHVIPRSGIAVDLGCFPGSWSRWLQQRGLTVVGVDLQAPDFAGEWITASVMEVEPVALTGHGAVDVLLSDMAPNTTGSRFTDHCRQIELAERALDLALATLRPGGAFVAKVFDGSEAAAFERRVREDFGNVRRFKPGATRDRSVEYFIVAADRR